MNNVKIVFILYLTFIFLNSIAQARTHREAYEESLYLITELRKGADVKSKLISVVNEFSILQLIDLSLDQNGNIKWYYSNKKFLGYNNRSLASTNSIIDSSKKPIDKMNSPLQAFGSISIIPYQNYFNIKGTDRLNGAGADLYSKNSHGVEFKWVQRWSQFFETKLIFDFNYTNFHKVSNRNYTNSKVNLSQSGLGLGLYFGSLMVSSDFIYGGNFYLFAPNSSTLRIDQANTLSNRTAINYNILSTHPFSLSMYLGLSRSLPTDIDTYKSELAIGTYSGLNFGQKLSHDKIIRGLVEVHQAKRDTTLISQDHEQIKVGIGLEWRFD